MIKVLVVDDSNFMRKVITQLVTRDPEISIIDTAGDGREALEKIRALKPDVVTMDIIMPLPDGIWALEEIMKQNPIPVIIVSSIANASSEIVEEAYSLGVTDVVQKPQNPQDMHKVGQELIVKIKAAAKIDKSRLLARLLPSAPVAQVKGIRQKAFSLLVIASSAGGPVGLDEVLSKIPKDFPSGILVVQHMPHEFLVSYIEHLSKKCCFPIRIARDGDVVLQRRILFSPGNATVELARTKKGGVVQITRPEVRLQPDIDLALASCGKVFADKVICVVLSGMGRYGVEGARIIKQAGGKIIAEDKSTAPVYGMPEAVLSEGLTDCVAPSFQITETIVNMLAGKKPCDVNKEDFLVKGIIIRACAKYLKDSCGDEKFHALTNSLSPELQQLIKTGFAVNMFYSGKLYLDFFRKIIEICVPSNVRLLEEIGQAEARTVIELYRQSLFARASGVEYLVGLMPRMLDAVFYGVRGDVLAIDVASRQGAIILRNKAYEKELAARVTRERACGWVKEMFASLLNIITVRINHETGSDAQGPFIKLNITW